MARTPSVMVPLGFKAPEFELLDVVSNSILKSKTLFGAKATMIMFICNHCPFVKYVNKQIVEIANIYDKLGIKFIAISSNDVENYPEDSHERMKKLLWKKNIPFHIYMMKVKKLQEIMMLLAHLIFLFLIKIKN